MTTPGDLLINRELSWLEFNQRVLDEAADAGHPLLERLKFLAITASNLDEFFMVRVGGLQLLAREGHRGKDASGLSPAEQLTMIDRRVRQMVENQYACFGDDLEPALAASGLQRVRGDTLDPAQEQVLEQIVEGEIYSVLTPMAITADQDCPLLIGGSLCLSVRLADDADNTPRFAWIPCGRTCPRILTLPSDGGYAYMLLEDVIAWSLARFFPGEEILECVPFRITRNADLRIREDAAADLLEGMQQIQPLRATGTRRANRPAHPQVPAGPARRCRRRRLSHSRSARFDRVLLTRRAPRFR